MAASTLTAEHLLDSLMYVIDPEVGINIVDLGLVYGVELDHGQATVSMTLTTPGAAARVVSRRRSTCPDLAPPGADRDQGRPGLGPRWGVEFISESGRDSSAGRSSV